MIIEQIYTGCLSQGAYYIESNGEVAIIDPLREVQPYIDKAKRQNGTIKYIFDELDYKLNPKEIDIECNGIIFDGVENNFFDFLFFFQKTNLIKYFYQKGILDFKKYNIEKGYKLFKKIKEPKSEEKILVEMWCKFVLDN